ncbi:MAG: hypothetical protein HY700_09170 [Gemmatimonadetes bacterium]|nr:hypothetical protein [Gemmatimonadota bacterium]
MRFWPARYVLRLWLVAAIAQAAGDVGLYLASRNIRNQLAWLDVRLTRPISDSLRHNASGYLRDSLGVTTARQGDTLVVRLPRRAERSLDTWIDSLRAASGRLIPWLAGAFLLLHLPLLVAILVTIAWIADRSSREANRARGAPWQEFEESKE